ncbi:hypothetical protein HY501_01285 [Candidatus Woesearchaeota archaeon]|nr:hypothetical protein [Candidatus Woesearchaeota archaeon]
MAFWLCLTFFFGINPQNGKEGIQDAIKHIAENVVKNKKNLNLLADKLYAYYNWKENTYKELKYTHNYRLKYLKQHYSVIKLYMNWLRPYLSTVQRLQMKGALTDADLVSAFETSKIQLELMAYKTSGKKYLPVVLVKFEHVTRPELIYTPQGQRQPVHMGRTEILIEPYVATKEQIEAYKAKQDKEDLEILGHIFEAMNALREDLEKFLIDADKLLEKEKNDERLDPPRPAGGLLEPYVSLLKGVREFLPGGKKKDGKKEDKMSAIELRNEKKSAEKTAAMGAWLVYDIFKKAHGYYNPV